MSGAQRDSGEISITPELTAASDSDRPSRASGRIAVHCAGRTAVGQVRDHNEDNFVVAHLGEGVIRPRDIAFEDQVDDRGMLFAVCDGMGGAAAGEVASQMAVDILVEAMRRGGSPKNRDGLARRLVNAVEEAGRRIFDAAQKERSRRGMGTTATVAVLVDKVMFIAEVGDSRAYLLRRGQLKQLTKDQSLVNQLIEAGHLTEDEAEAFEHSNIILQALGTSEAVQVDLTFVELRRGDRLMMCSDGLSGLVHTEALRATMLECKDPAECCRKLIEQAETAGGHDNITVVVADFDGEGMVEAGDSDSFGYVQYPLPLAEDEGGAFNDEETTSSGGRPSTRHTDAGDDGDDSEDEQEGLEHDEETGESLLPLHGDGGDTRANALWILGGVVALVAAMAVWFTLDPASSEEHGEEMVAATPPVPAPSVEPPAVDVNVHTDVEGATLVVNGEAKGDLSANHSRTLQLRPGAYRLEAQRDGSQVTSTVVTVRGDIPMDVFLQLPKGASVGGGESSTKETASEGAQPAGEKPEASAARRERSEELQAARAERRAAAREAREAAEASVREAAAPAVAPEPSKEPVVRREPIEAAPKPVADAPVHEGVPAPATKPVDIPENPF
jgi:protein phosphatase